MKNNTPHNIAYQISFPLVSRSICWDVISQQKRIKLKKLPTIELIKNELSDEDSYLIEYEVNSFDSKYFNSLVKLLPKYRVSEIRPFQKIWIIKGTESKYILPYLDDILVQIKKYKILRTTIFNRFLNSLEIENIEGNFYKLREKLQETDKWPKGVYENWSYWSHGGDIEFDNESTGEHFNIRMANIQSLKFWSIHKFIRGTNKDSDLGKFIKDKKEVVSKIFDLLVVENKMKVIRTDFGEKQYELIN